jgi:hypothetical protein
VQPVPVPADCINEAYYARPERLLDPGARRACSAWSFVEPSVSAQYVDRLRDDLQSGAWDERHGALRQQPYLNGSLVLIRAIPG